MPAVRVQKIIAEAGLASRREAEEWIREGRVRVNGQVAKLGDRADPVDDAVRVDGKRIHPRTREKSYVLLNKPRGYVTTVHDPESRHTVLELLPPGLSRAVKPVGRLDVQTEGLLLLTDDGDLAAQITRPSTGPPKEYRVKVSGVPTEAKLAKVRRGIPLDGRPTRPSEIERISTTARGDEGNTWLKVVLKEGRTRQIRRMFQAIGHPVFKLKRVAIGPIRDATLPTGAWRPLSPAEVERLRRAGPRSLPEKRPGRRREDGRVSFPAPPPVVAIDGPSGAGKSTVARALATRLGVPYIDTGAMYRAVGLAARDRGVPLPVPDPAAVEAIADAIDLDLDLPVGETRVRLDGRDVSREIRLPEISLYASAVSAIPAVRRRLVAAQRRLAATRGGVLEGRDIGTRVFPDTPHKFFLTAPLEVRAERRARELALRGTPQPADVVRAEIESRDRADSTRSDSPLTLDERYVVVDTGRRSVEEVVDELESRVRERQAGRGAGDRSG